MSRNMNSYGMNGGDGGNGDHWSARGRGRSNNRPEKQDELRRPHQKPSEIVEQVNARTTEMVKKSTLSPNAREFIPRSHVPTQSSDILNYSAQSDDSASICVEEDSDLNDMYDSCMVEENDYEYYEEESCQNDLLENCDYSEACFIENISLDQRKNNDAPVTDLNITISQMESSIRVLTMSPGEFDRLVAHLVDIINPFLENPSQLKEIISVIINQSITEGNFRYNGARLCTHLDTVALPQEGTTSTFREILLQQCEEKKDNQCTAWQRIEPECHSEEDEKKCHGLILFLAELVTQMQTSASTLGKMLIHLISQVLHNPARSSAKNICQALKLAGQALERENVSARKEMEIVMRQLTGLVASGRVDPQVGRMVESVRELRSNSWGRATNITPACRPSMTSQNIPTQSYEALDEPVFYGPDGKVISAEESAFLHGFVSDKEDEYNEEYDLDYLDPDPEGDALCTAYEEFLKLSKNSNHIKN